MARITNQQVAEALGISNSMASLLRSGKRFPSVRLMRRIEVVYRWKMSAQTKVHGTPEYAERFNYCINRLEELKNAAAS